MNQAGALLLLAALAALAALVGVLCTMSAARRRWSRPSSSGRLSGWP